MDRNAPNPKLGDFSAAGTPLKFQGGSQFFAKFAADGPLKTPLPDFSQVSAGFPHDSPTVFNSLRRALAARKLLNLHRMFHVKRVRISTRSHIGPFLHG